MKTSRLLALPLALALAACASTPPHATTDARGEVARQVGNLLHAYAANDPAAVLALLDRRGFAMYGSDVAEVVHDPAGLRQLMADDFALWRTARFGAPANMDIRVEGTAASAFFDVPFSAGGRPPVTVRFGTAWRYDDGHWVLMQSSNTVPTTGSSAHELISSAL
ncbi:MAG TPA: hypothetical protein VN043_10475 [Rhodanobacter sp.]|jgi:hypothetical protein|nr:hypothetical protein [Rhodanobacter sp.]